MCKNLKISLTYIETLEGIGLTCDLVQESDVIVSSVVDISSVVQAVTFLKAQCLRTFFNLTLFTFLENHPCHHPRHTKSTLKLFSVCKRPCVCSAVSAAEVFHCPKLASNMYP